MKRVEGCNVYGFVQHVVCGMVYLERCVALEEDLYGRSASLHADDDGEQMLPNAVYHCWLLGDDVFHAHGVRRAVPSLWFRSHRRGDEFLLGWREFGNLRAANEPVLRKEPQRLCGVHLLPP